MKLTDILPLDRWIELEKEINARFGLDANVFDTAGIRISDFKKWANKLCPEIKATDKGQSFICAVAHMNIANQAMESRQAVIEECDAGLVKVVVPIFADDTFLGAVGACGVLLDDGEVETFLIDKITGISEEKAEALAADIGAIKREDAEELARFVQGKIDGILDEYLTSA
jgi:ligand-binding sensor protein